MTPIVIFSKSLRFMVFEISIEIIMKFGEKMKPLPVSMYHDFCKL